MNEQIRELARQAEDWADKQNFYESDYQDYLMEKFAELIVRECAQVARHHALCHSGVAADFAGTVEIQQSILKHFGVDE